jgi:hypothetical protein
MFGFNALGAMPLSMQQMLPYASLALGGGNFPSQPANPNAGGQAPMNEMGRMPQARPSIGMFGNASPMGDFRKGWEGPMSTPPIKAPSSASEAAVLNQQGGGIDVLNQGPLAPDQFSLGRDLARASEVAPIKAKHGPNWGNIAQAVAMGLNGYLASQGNPVGLANIRAFQDMRQRALEHQYRMDEKRQEQFDPMSVGGSLVQRQEDGSYKTLYDAPQAFEKYAMALGLQPGTPEYHEAVQSYRLGSWSDPAMENRLNLEGVRYQNRDALQDQRLGVTMRGQDLSHQDRQSSIRQSNTNNIRSTGVSSANNIRSTNQSNANSIRSAETTRGSYSYSHGGKGRGAGAASGEGQVIVNPTTGQRMQLKGGQWVPIK